MQLHFLLWNNFPFLIYCLLFISCTIGPKPATKIFIIMKYAITINLSTIFTFTQRYSYSAITSWTSFSVIFLDNCKSSMILYKDSSIFFSCCQQKNARIIQIAVKLNRDIQLNLKRRKIIRFLLLTARKKTDFQSETIFKSS